MNKKVKIIAFFTLIAMLLVLLGCTSQSPIEVSQTPTAPLPNPIEVSQTPTAPLSWLLEFVPSTHGNQLVYNDILTLSAEHNVSVPSSWANDDEVVKWWVTIENHFLIKSYVAPLRMDIWGFNPLALEGFLTVIGKEPVTILVGHLDTVTFREMLLNFEYTEESYLGFPIFSGSPQLRSIGSTLDPRILGVLPRAFSVIDGLSVNGDNVNAVIMANLSLDKPPVPDEVTEAKKVIQSVLKAYNDKTTLAYQTGGITAFAYSLGKVGSAFIANASDLRFDELTELLSKHPMKNIVELSIGPGKLSPYTQLAITFTQKDNDSLLEFILAYPDSDTAIANVNVLQARLNESYTPYSFEGVGKVGPFSQFWSVQSVQAEGALLRGVVKLTEQAASSYSFLKDLIQYDYLFLYPGSSDSIS
jgi:hypothetical protein